ncbi:MAG: acyl carrier protein [Firmicutes bacterium]|jgi:acyl carrier protein|nr:acyl carrier protein [Bacillota bacterium]
MIKELLINIIKEECGIDLLSLPRDEDLYLLDGWDSVTLLRLSSVTEEETGKSINLYKLLTALTVGDLLAVMDEA